VGEIDSLVGVTASPLAAMVHAIVPNAVTVVLHSITVLALLPLLSLSSKKEIQENQAVTHAAVENKTACVSMPRF
jgi:hypothetical protein